MILNFGRGRENMRKEKKHDSNVHFPLQYNFRAYDLRNYNDTFSIRRVVLPEPPRNQEDRERGREREREKKKLTVAIINEVVERVMITGVSELVVVGGQLLQALHSYRTEVPVESCVLCEYICPACHEAVNERLSPHRTPLRRKI